MTPPLSSTAPRSARLFVPALLALGCLVWAYWTTLTGLAQEWKNNDQYSHGFLVPFFAAFLLWQRRGRLDAASLRPNPWVGVSLLALGIGMRLVGVYYFYMWLDPLSLLPCLMGLCWLLGGRAAWRWSWSAILFLSFMIPLPYRFASSLSGPLQRVGTEASTFIMQVLGLPAISEGTVIWLQDAPINIVEACSGLRMLMVFVALSTAMALVARRPLLDRAILVLSAFPIAIISNVIRITTTGILHQLVSGEAANAFFHDFAGWLMMPLALTMLAIELKVLKHLFIEPAPQERRPQAAPALRRLRGPRTAQPRPAARQPRSPRQPRPAASAPANPKPADATSPVEKS
jgi:exosortase